MKGKAEFAGLLPVQRRQGSYYFSELWKTAEYLTAQYSLYFSEVLQGGRKPAATSLALKSLASH